MAVVRPSKLLDLQRTAHGAPSQFARFSRSPSVEPAIAPATVPDSRQFLSGLPFEDQKCSSRLDGWRESLQGMYPILDPSLVRLRGIRLGV